MWFVILRCMRCPIDKSSMNKLRVDDVYLDVCTECSGVWLDKGEMHSLIQHFSSGELDGKLKR